MSATFRPSSTTSFLFKIGEQTFPCSMGKNGVKIEKKEGDNATPAGEFALRKIFYRADKILDPDELKQLRKSSLPITAIQENDGWCDDANSEYYNRLIKLPFEPSHEKLWRTDDLYDIFVVIGYNDGVDDSTDLEKKQTAIEVNTGIKKGKGSAIFLHIAKKDYAGTAGCIGLTKADLLTVLPQLTPHSRIKITTSGAAEIIQPKLELTEELTFPTNQF